MGSEFWGPSVQNMGERDRLKVLLGLGVLSPPCGGAHQKRAIVELPNVGGIAQVSTSTGPGLRLVLNSDVADIFPVSPLGLLGELRS